MKKRLAYLCLAAIAFAIASADYFVLTSTAAISAIAEREIDAIFGPQLEHGRVTASLDGVVELGSVGLNLIRDKEKIRVLSADRVKVRGALRGGTYISESIVLTDPIISLDQRLFDSPSHEPREPLRETYPHDLPRIRCVGGQIEIIDQRFFHWSAPQTFAILEIVLVPVSGYRYLAAGSLHSDLLGDWRISGDFDLDGGSLHLDLASEEVTLGPKLRAVLAPNLVPEWDRYRPDGRARIRVGVDAEPGEPMKLHATVEPLGMSICYAGFPYAVDDARGEIDFFADRFDVKSLSARSGNTRIRFDGSAGGYGGKADFKFRIEIDSMPMDEKLRAALSPGARAVYDRFRPSGTIDVRGLVIREYGLNKPVRNPLDIAFREAQFRYLPFPYEVTGVRGEVHIDSPRVEVKHLVGRHGDGALEFEGLLDDIDADAIIDLFIRGKNIALDSTLKQAIPEETHKIWDRFSPSGPVDIEWHVTKAKGEKEVHRSETTARGGRVTYQDVPLPVSDVIGQVSYGPDELRLSNLSGKLDSGEVTVTGSAIEAPDGTHHSYDISASGVLIDARFRKAMPKAVATLLDTLQLSGTARFQLHLEIVGQTPTKWNLHMELHHGVMDTALRFEEVDGVVDVIGPIASVGPADKDQFSGTGTISLREARIMKKKVSDAAASFRVRGDEITFNTIQAKAYGGVVSIDRLKLNMKTTELSAESITADRVDLGKYVGDTESYANRVLAGKVNVEIDKLAGMGNDTKTLTGDGTITITDGQLFEVPAIATIFKLSPFSATKRFDAGKITFKIANRRFEVKTMGFQSDDGSIIGRGGWLDFDGKYHLRIRVEPAPILGIKFFFTDILSSVFSQLMRTTIDGNLESAQAEVKEEKEPKEPPKEAP